ncbi:MAG: adenylosuccinate lyase [Pelagibacteraceae bacterium TMED237]|nr:adenylosuccinate lyase [Candidatus Neomarinimicrobiota bacterium]OUW96624.1 MAG: adenylosuccinate lyase [Pelagibacteraceae bacterium TMED237]|tara:strand:- start:2417 stop:3715 length:1299 start_codon:yes stop_codon:yes gene_type:complete
MIDRYQTERMKEIWSDNNKFRTWLQVEIAAVEVLCNHNIVPQASVNVIKEKADFDKERILEIEKETRHDVIAFLTNVAEYVGPDSRYIHMGMTSSDLLDTSLALLCKEAGGVILDRLILFHDLLRSKAKKYKNTFQIGRSHGVHAEPITFGLKMALWSDEINRHIDRLKSGIDSISIGKISGAVGTYQHLDPKVEHDVCNKLGIKAANVSNQVVQRDGHAHFLQTLALIGASIEKISIEIRHLQRTEVLEAEEFFKKGQKGSSAMPHKRNPIVTERMTGFARLLRSNAHVAVENVALWHERDISHSSVERIIIPDSTTLVHYMLIKMYDLIDNLIVYPDRMLDNINSTNGLIFSQEVLLALIKKGLVREEAYKLVQKNAMKSWNEGSSFMENIKSDSNIMSSISVEELESLFDLDKILININKIYKRMGLDG